MYIYLYIKGVVWETIWYLDYLGYAVSQSEVK